jgi:hypothetical protein
MSTRHRHFRCDDDPWDAAQQRAIGEGTTISALLREFVVAYGAGRVARDWTTSKTKRKVKP